MAIKKVKGIFQTCLYQRHHIQDQERMRDRTVEDALLAEVAKQRDLFGKPAEFKAQ